SATATDPANNTSEFSRAGSASDSSMASGAAAAARDSSATTSQAGTAGTTVNVSRNPAASSLANGVPALAALLSADSSSDSRSPGVSRQPVAEPLETVREFQTPSVPSSPSSSRVRSTTATDCGLN